MMTKIIIIDESVSFVQMTKVLNYLKFNENKIPEIVHIKSTYPGIPDEEILKHIIKKDSIFVTTDRVMHNKVVLNNKKSLYIDKDGIIIRNILKGIKIPVKNTNNIKTELLSSYEINKTEIHEKILPDTEIQLKKLRTKRRRIRNYFEGIDNIKNIDVSLSKISNKDKILIGIKIRAISNNGIKSLDASEIYIIENKNADEKFYLCYVLIALLRLMFNTKNIAIYYDSNEITGDFETKEKTEFSELFQVLKSYFDRITTYPVNKGKNIELLRNKLGQLLQKDAGNEIIKGDIGIIKHKIITND